MKTSAYAKRSSNASREATRILRRRYDPRFHSPSTLSLNVHQLYTHSKILVAALNGPVMGMSHEVHVPFLSHAWCS